MLIVGLYVSSLANRYNLTLFGSVCFTLHIMPVILAKMTQFYSSGIQVHNLEARLTRTLDSKNIRATSVNSSYRITLCWPVRVKTVSASE